MIEQCVSVHVGQCRMRILSVWDLYQDPAKKGRIRNNDLRASYINTEPRLRREYNCNEKLSSQRILL
jgi:hypothetical protein